MKCLMIAAAIITIATPAIAKPKRIALDANGIPATQVIGGRPAGCPYRYCGCGLRKFLGLTDVRLNLAAAWAKIFPHTTAHDGAVAVRRGGGHVMQLVRQVAGDVWIVRDYNGGRGLSYIHARSVRGYTFVTVNGGQNVNYSIQQPFSFGLEFHS